MIHLKSLGYKTLMVDAKLPERVALFGPNGSGKSTIIEAIQVALTGRVALDGIADRPSAVLDFSPTGSVLVDLDLGRLAITRRIERADAGDCRHSILINGVATGINEAQEVIDQMVMALTVDLRFDASAAGLEDLLNRSIPTPGPWAPPRVRHEVIQEMSGVELKEGTKVIMGPWLQRIGGEPALVSLPAVLKVLRGLVPSGSKETKRTPKSKELECPACRHRFVPVSVQTSAAPEPDDRVPALIKSIEVLYGKVRDQAALALGDMSRWLDRNSRLRIDQLGFDHLTVWSDNHRVPYHALSFGQRIQVATAILTSALQVAPHPYKILMIECGECDQDVVVECMRTLAVGRDPKDHVILARHWSRLSAPIVVDGWLSTTPQEFAGGHKILETIG